MRKLMLLLVAGLLAACADVPTEPECVVAERWVAAHATKLPATLAELQRFDRTFQRAIYNAVTPAVRADLWREHLAAVLAGHPELTGPERAFIATARAEAGAWVATSRADLRLKVFEDAGVQLLGEPLFAEAFVRLGGGGVTPQMTVGPCECATDFNYGSDCGGGECRIEIDCRVTWFGCGTWSVYPCNGMCE